MSQDPHGKDPLSIVTDPNNYVNADKALGAIDEDAFNAQEEKEASPQEFSRRNFLKFGGAAAAAVSVAASGAAGFATGRSSDAYTGYGRTAAGDDMFFNREPFRTDVPAMFEPVGKVERAEWYHFQSARLFTMFDMIKNKTWNPGMTAEEMPGELGEFFQNNPERYAATQEDFRRSVRRLDYWHETARKQFALAGAYTMAYGHAFHGHQGQSTYPECPSDVYRITGEEQPPEKWDYRYVSKYKQEFKSPAHATKLIKRMAHLFGASVVGICKFDPTYMFKDTMRGMKENGHAPGEKWGDKVPSHWKSIITFGIPMHWDSTYAAIGYSTSFDAYFRSRCTAGVLEAFIQELGYPARAQFPPYNYEIMVAPYMMLSGMAEYSRAGMAMVPEVGCNIRPAAVITDIEFEYDKPIDVKMADFCKKCKICADTCPSGAITHDDEPQTVVRGFKRWQLDEDKCFTQWVSGSTIDGLGCRVCVAVCPYSRKNTWIHTISRELEPRDPTGLVADALLGMQQNFFKYPTGEEFRAPWDGGKEATYHNPPTWERSEEFFSNIQKEWEYHGMY